MSKQQSDLSYGDFLAACSQADDAQRRLLGGYALRPERLAPVVTGYLGELGYKHQFARVERLDVLQVDLAGGTSAALDGPCRLFEDDQRVLVTATPVSDAGADGLQSLSAPTSARASTVAFLVVRDCLRERDLTDQGVPPLSEPTEAQGFEIFRYGYLVTPAGVHVGRQYLSVAGYRNLDPDLWELGDDELTGLHRDLQHLLLGVRR